MDTDEIELHLGREALRISAAMMTLRLWMETVPIFLKYLQIGKDSPFREACGGISDLVNRSEIQPGGNDGKLPHQHTLLYFKFHPQTEEEAQPLLDLIRGSIETFATPQEQKQLIEKGFILDADLMITFLQKMATITKHHCSRRCSVKVRVVTPDGSFETKQERRCKQPDNRMMNPHPFLHFFRPIEVHHSEEALQSLLVLGLIEASYRIDSNCLEGCYPRPEYKHLLEAKRHIPPCYATDGPYSPANPFVFAMLLSAVNLQFCTSYLLLRYLAKYVGQIDKAGKFVIKAGNRKGGDDTKMTINMEDTYNTKITGNLIEERRLASGKVQQFQMIGRELPLAEMFMQFLKYPTIITTLKYEYVPTQPMAERPILKKKSYVTRMIEQGRISNNGIRGPCDLDAGAVFPCLTKS
jgi:hypothetical protein